jgi:hypothetical protein
VTTDDPGFSMNCPLCGARLVYLRTEGETHFYRCDRHGMLMLPPDGRVRQVPGIAAGCSSAVPAAGGARRGFTYRSSGANLVVAVGA